MFTKSSLGLEICQEGAKFALIKGRHENLELLGCNQVVFSSDTIKNSIKELNVLNPTEFVARVRDAYNKILTPIKRVSVSLPDSTGRSLVVDLDARFNSKEDGIAMIRWKLKKSFPIDIQELNLDFQILQERGDGTTSLLVSCISRNVISQYERLLEEVGLEPFLIDFTTFNIHHLFENRLNLSENSALVIYYGGVLSILIFCDGKLEFFRSKEVPKGLSDPGRLFRDINNSFLVYKDKALNPNIIEIFCVAAYEEIGALCDISSEVFKIDPVMLDVERAVRLRQGFKCDSKTLASMIAAIGVATRNL